MAGSIVLAAVAAVALCAGCRIPDEQFMVGDGARDGAGDGSTGCDLARPFDPPVMITELDDPLLSELNPRLSHDELVIYYWTRPTGVPSGGDVVTATRSTPGGTFGSPKNLALDDAAVQRDPSVTGDNLRLYFASDKASAGISKIYAGTRLTTGTDFSGGALVPGLDTGAGDDIIEPYVLPNDQIIYFAVQVSGTTTHELYVSRRGAGGSAYMTPYTAPFANINATGVENCSPVITVDLQTVYFESNRAGSQGIDIWKASRGNMSAPFTNVVPVAELNTSESESPGWISDDGCRLYFARSPTNGHDWKLYVASKPRL